jgi:hypothetical protein
MPAAADSASNRFNRLNRLPVIRGSRKVVKTATVDIQLIPTDAFENLIAA